MPFIGKNPTSGFSTIVKDDLTADGSTTAFTLSKQVASANDVAVFVGNVRQEPTNAYSVSGTTLTMTAAPASGINFYVLHIAGTLESSVIPADGTITSAKMDTNIALDGTLTLNGVTPQTTYAIQTADKSVYLSSTDATYSNVTIRKGSATTTDYMQIRNDANTLMYKVDSNGYVSKPKHPVFRATSDNNSQSLTNLTNTVVVFDVAETNIGSCYNTSNGKFTAPVAGFYSFNASLLLSQGGSDRMDLCFYKNGTVHIAHEFRDTGSSSTNASVTAGGDMYLNASDYVEVVVALHGANGSVYSEPKFWNFSGYLVA